VSRDLLALLHVSWEGERGGCKVGAIHLPEGGF